MSVNIETKQSEDLYEEPKNLVQLFEGAFKNFKDLKLFGTKNSSGVYEWVTYGEIGERVANLRNGLSTLGIKKGDKVGIIANNRTEWFIAEAASLGLGAIWIPMYEKELESMWEYVIGDSEISALFVANSEIADKIKAHLSKFEKFKHIIVIDAEKDFESSDSMKTMEELENAGKDPSVSSAEPIFPKYDEVAVIIYTSGTTGAPKGVQLTHGNLTFCAQAGRKVYPVLDKNTVSLSHLPWAHSYGLSAELHNILQFGGSIGFMESLETISDDLKNVRPTVLISVPRVFSKVYDKIYHEMNEEGGIKLKLFKMAVDAAIQKFRTGKSTFKYKLLDKMVLKKIRDIFGGRLELVLTASARMNEVVAEFFFSIGIPCYDAYGLSETSPALTMNSPVAYRFGTVGKPLMKTHIVIDKSIAGEDSKDGEILAFGPQIMLGYLNKPEQTAKVIIEHPEFGKGVRTGDRGWIDEDGFLHITGRFKEEYKLENGKYVFPAIVEEAITTLPYVKQCMLYGDGKPYNVCIIVPEADFMDEKMKEVGFISTKPDDIITNQGVQDLISRDIKAHLSGKLGGYEIPKKFLYILDEFTLENEMLTQTMKLKRRKVLENYKEQLDALYE